MGNYTDFNKLLHKKKTTLIILIVMNIIVQLASMLENKSTKDIISEDIVVTQGTEYTQLQEIDNLVADDTPDLYGYDDELLGLEPPKIIEDFIEINEYSRIGQKLDRVDNIVVHYVGNPGTTAEQNRNYYQELKITQETKVSSNYVVGLGGEIIEAVPRYEVAYASNELNRTSISIEVCHYTEVGNFTKETLDSLIHLCAWLCLKYDLKSTDVIRHYDVTGKNCPKYYVENQSEWDDFLKQIEIRMN